MAALASALRYGILATALAPLGFYVFAMVAAWRFFSRERKHEYPSFTPPISLLKPVHGVDFASRENFASFCELDYPEYEIVFGVNDASDPAIPLIERLKDSHPELPIRLSIGAKYFGPNQKVNQLAHLAKLARHEFIVLTDGDVRVGSSFLREVVAPLADGAVGATTCFYRAVTQGGVGGDLEAVGAASDFFAGVLVANATEGMGFALGAAIAMSKKWVAAIGGFEAIAEYLADDFELGRRIAQSGGRVLLSREGVWTMYPKQALRGFWQHQLRWARTVRLCRPWSYLGLLFTHGLPWALLAAIVAPTTAVALGYLAAYLIFRLVMAWVVGVWGVRDAVLRRNLWLVPLRDAIHFLVWVAGFFSNRVVWSGKEFTVQRGRMAPVAVHPTNE